MEPERREGADDRPYWELWRQDDHGNRVLVARFKDHVVALQALARFECQHHKQTYWLEEKRGASPEDCQTTAPIGSWR